MESRETGETEQTMFKTILWCQVWRLTAVALNTNTLKQVGHGGGAVYTPTKHKYVGLCTILLDMTALVSFC